MAIILNKTNNGVSRGQFNMDLNANSKAFRALSIGLYKKPKLAIVRELISNAIDASKLVQKDDNKIPVIVEISNELFSVQDFGIGMSLEQVFETFSVYFNSSKENNINQIGGFGLGGKTPFIYTNEFTLETTCPEDGIRRTFIFKMDGNIPSFNYLEELDKQNSSIKGTKVFFSIKEYKDVSEFLITTQSFASFCNHPIVIKNNDKEYSLSENILNISKQLSKYKLYKFYLSKINKDNFNLSTIVENENSNLYIRYNGIIYSSPFQLKISFLNKNLDTILAQSLSNIFDILSKGSCYNNIFLLEIDNALLELNISRDNIIDSHENKKIIINHFFNVAIKNINSIFTKEIEFFFEKKKNIHFLSEKLNFLLNSHKLYEATCYFLKNKEILSKLDKKYEVDLNNLFLLCENFNQHYLELLKEVEKILKHCSILKFKRNELNKRFNYEIHFLLSKNFLNTDLKHKTFYFIEKEDKYLKKIKGNFFETFNKICFIEYDKECLLKVCSEKEVELEKERLSSFYKTMEDFFKENSKLVEKKNKKEKIKTNSFHITPLSDLLNEKNKQYKEPTFIICENFLKNKDILLIEYLMLKNNLVNIKFIFLDEEDYYSIGKNNTFTSTSNNLIYVNEKENLFSYLQVYCEKILDSFYKEWCEEENVNKIFNICLSDFLNDPTYKHLFISSKKTDEKFYKLKKFLFNQKCIQSIFKNDFSYKTEFDFNKLKQFFEEKNNRNINLNIQVKDILSINIRNVIVFYFMLEKFYASNIKNVQNLFMKNNTDVLLKINNNYTNEYGGYNCFIKYFHKNNLLSFLMENDILEKLVKIINNS